MIVPLHHISIHSFFNDRDVDTSEVSDNRADYLAQRLDLYVIKDAASSAARVGMDAR